MRFSLGSLLLCIGLGGCSTLPQESILPRNQVDAFSLEARFALRTTPAGQPAQSSSGRLSWIHDQTGDRVLLSSPLGYGIAEIAMTPTLSHLKTADGNTRSSSDPEALLEEVTGQRLPVRRLPAWLLGRSPAIRLDASGRPQHLAEAGWLIDYTYAETGMNALPSGLTLRREQEIELRLRIEEWKTP